MLGKHREEGEEVLGLRVFFLRLRLFWKCRIHIFRTIFPLYLYTLLVSLWVVSLLILKYFEQFILFC